MPIILHVRVILNGVYATFAVGLVNVIVGVAELVRLGGDVDVAFEYGLRRLGSGLHP